MAWFHNHRVTKNWEEAIDFYIGSDSPPTAVVRTTEDVMQ